jgi:hypothetical protein
VPTSDEVAAADEVPPAVDEVAAADAVPPAVGEVPAVDEPPAADEGPAVEEPPPAVEVPPAALDGPVAEEAAASDEMAVADEPPVVDEVPAAVEAPPAVEEPPPAVEAPPAGEEPAAAVDVPAVEEPPAAFEEPAADEVPAPGEVASSDAVAPTTGGRTLIGLPLRSLAVVVAAALCIPCVVLLTLFLLRSHSRSAVDDARGAAVRSARTAAMELLAYDYRHIADDIAAAKKLNTKPYSGEYDQATTTLQSQAVQLKAIVQADVRTTAVEDAKRNRVVVLLFVDQTSVKNLPGQSKPVTRVDEQRVRMTMVRTHGHWLVSEVAALL